MESITSGGVNGETVSSPAAVLEQAASFVVRRAREIVGELVMERGRQGPPFLAEDLARLQGIKRIERVDLGNTDALLLGVGDGYVMKVNMNRSFFRQNFSCAHEIGHTLLHEFEHKQSNGGVDFRLPTLGIRQRDWERLCDMAATELLMPGDVFSQYLSQFGVSVLAIDQLSRTFAVSKPAIAVRIAELSEEPCIAVMWRRWQRRRSRGFLLVWLPGSGRQAYDGGYRIRERTYVRDPSGILKAYKCAETVTSSRCLSFGGIKKRCYTESKAFGADNMRYVLSLVFPERQKLQKQGE